jgi:hypothetical protein
MTFDLGYFHGAFMWFNFYTRLGVSHLAQSEIFGNIGRVTIWVDARPRQDGQTFLLSFGDEEWLNEPSLPKRMEDAARIAIADWMSMGEGATASVYVRPDTQSARWQGDLVIMPLDG